MFLLKTVDTIIPISTITSNVLIGTEMSLFDPQAILITTEGKMMGIEIADKVALVTGANRGIGRTIVDTFIEHGARKVYLAVRNPDSAIDLVEKYADKVEVLQVDMANATSINDLAAKAKDAEIVVNSAGVLEIASPLSDHVEEAFNNELTINVFGLIRIAKAFAPVLEANGGGALVQLNSVASLKNFSKFATYSASKAAAYSITQGLKDELKPKNIHVLSVHPGPIATDMGSKAGFDDVAEATSVVSEGIVDALKAGDFHLFPDTMAKQFYDGYRDFAQNVIEADQ